MEKSTQSPLKEGTEYYLVSPRKGWLDSTHPSQPKFTYKEPVWCYGEGAGLERGLQAWELGTNGLQVPAGEFWELGGGSMGLEVPKFGDPLA